MCVPFLNWSAEGTVNEEVLFVCVCVYFSCTTVLLHQYLLNRFRTLIYFRVFRWKIINNYRNYRVGVITCWQCLAFDLQVEKLIVCNNGHRIFRCRIYIVGLFSEFTNY